MMKILIDLPVWLIKTCLSVNFYRGNTFFFPFSDEKRNQKILKGIRRFLRCQVPAINFYLNHKRKTADKMLTKGHFKGLKFPYKLNKSQKHLLGVVAFYRLSLHAFLCPDRRCQAIYRDIGPELVISKNHRFLVSLELVQRLNENTRVKIGDPIVSCRKAAAIKLCMHE